MRTISQLVPVIRDVGLMALDRQHTMRFSDREYKKDGSVLTETDKAVEAYVSERIRSMYPDANIVAEETIMSFDPQKKHTFVLDPVDGTDSFSQGMHGWCVSLALLDASLQPIAGILFAPALDLLLFADVAMPFTLNSHPMPKPQTDQRIEKNANLIVSSRVHQQIDLSPFPGKLRSLGSAALHLAFPVVYPSVIAALQQKGTFIWDIAGADAICRSVGFEMRYSSGRQISYQELIAGKSTEDLIFSGADSAIATLTDLLFAPEGNASR